jgi:cell division initiation protein
MSGEKRFRKSFFGYRKQDVNSYIEKVVGDYDIKLNENEEEIALLNRQIKELKTKYEEILSKSDKKGLIDLALISAHESAEKIIEDAKLKAMEEKKKLDSILENDRERIVDMKQLLKNLKDNAARVLKQFEGEIDSLLDDNEDKDNVLKIS